MGSLVGEGILNPCAPLGNGLRNRGGTRRKKKKLTLTIPLNQSLPFQHKGDLSKDPCFFRRLSPAFSQQISGSEAIP